MPYHLLVGDCMTRLRELPDNSVHLVVTSPPYYGLRDYKIAPSIWGGQPRCVHVWRHEELPTEVGRGNWTQATNGRGEVQGASHVVSESRRKFRLGLG